MADTAETIRRRIEHYRGLLAQGISADVARMYLEQIAKDHAALRDLGEEYRSEGDPPPQRPSR